MTLHDIPWHCIVLYCITCHCSPLHRRTLRYIELHNMTLHGILHCYETWYDMTWHDITWHDIMTWQFNQQTHTHYCKPVGGSPWSQQVQRIWTFADERRIRIVAGPPETVPWRRAQHGYDQGTNMNRRWTEQNISGGLSIPPKRSRAYANCTTRNFGGKLQHFEVIPGASYPARQENGHR